MNKLKHDKLGKQNKKESLTQISSNNNLMNKLHALNDNYVVSLKDTEKTESGSSTATTHTVIPSDKERNINRQEIPMLVITAHSTSNTDEKQRESGYSKTTTTSKSTKTQSTCSTVQENLVTTSFRSGDSPVQTSTSKGKKYVI